MTTYEVITDRIIAQLEKGVAPWRKPWIGGSPKNLISGKEYRGVNVLMLASASYASRYWLTYKQATDIGGHVKQGEHGYPVVFWKTLEGKPDPDKQDGETSSSEKASWLLRYSTVFNVNQCELPEKLLAKIAIAEELGIPFDPIAACEETIKGMPNPPSIGNGEPQAYYRPSTDSVNMPVREVFRSAQAYYHTLFHELTHSTGHASRLNRTGITELAGFGTNPYAREELVAEIGAAFVSGACGIDGSETQEDTAAYCQAWIARLRGDSKLILQTSSAAQKAADYILAR